MANAKGRAVVPTNVGLKPDAAELLDQLAERTGQTKAALIGHGLRLFAATMGKLRIEPEDQGELPLAGPGE